MILSQSLGYMQFSALACQRAQQIRTAFLTRQNYGGPEFFVPAVVRHPCETRVATCGCWPACPLANGRLCSCRSFAGSRRTRLWWGDVLSTPGWCPCPCGRWSGHSARKNPSERNFSIACYPEKWENEKTKVKNRTTRDILEKKNSLTSSMLANVSREPHPLRDVDSNCKFLSIKIFFFQICLTVIIIILMNIFLKRKWKKLLLLFMLLLQCFLFRL